MVLYTVYYTSENRLSPDGKMLVWRIYLWISESGLIVGSASVNDKNRPLPSAIGAGALSRLQMLQVCYNGLMKWSGGRSVKAGRKVRTPQGAVVGNTHPFPPETAGMRESATEKIPPNSDSVGMVRVKRCGKSAPRPWRHGWHGKPHRVQDQIGNRSAGPAHIHPPQQAPVKGWRMK